LIEANVEQSITQGSLRRSVWRLSWPIALSSALQFFPGIYDAYWLGTLGSSAQGAAGLMMAVRITMISVLMALSLGGGAVVSRYVGAGDKRRANLTVLQGILLFALAAGTLGAVGVIFVRPLMELSGADADTLPLAIQYARIIFFGLIALEMVPSMGGMLQAAGAPEVMLGMTAVSAATLIATEPLLVHWLDIEGAALAMVVSNVAGMVYGLGVLLAGRAPVRLDLGDLRIDPSIMGSILRVALPAIVLRFVPNLAALLLTRIVAWYGASVLAAWIIVQRVYRFVTIPSMGVTRTAPAMVGQNLGAAQPDRATQSVRLIARAAALIGALLIGLLVVFAPQTMALFSSDHEAITEGVRAIRMIGIGYLAFTVGLVFDMAQSGAGDTVSPMVINLVSLWLVQVPLAYALSQMTDLGAASVWLAFNLGWTIQAVLLFVRYRQGRWKHVRVV
jgi:putative MATE family efflux protein